MSVFPPPSIVLEVPVIVRVVPLAFRVPAPPKMRFPAIEILSLKTSVPPDG